MVRILSKLNIFLFILEIYKITLFIILISSIFIRAEFFLKIFYIVGSPLTILNIGRDLMLSIFVVNSVILRVERRLCLKNKLKCISQKQILLIEALSGWGLFATFCWLAIGFISMQ